MNIRWIQDRHLGYNGFLREGKQERITFRVRELEGFILLMAWSHNHMLMSSRLTNMSLAEVQDYVKLVLAPQIVEYTDSNYDVSMSLNIGFRNNFKAYMELSNATENK